MANKEEYSDPTAERAVKAAGRMPTHVYNSYNVINDVAGILGLN